MMSAMMHLMVNDDVDGDDDDDFNDDDDNDDDNDGDDDDIYNLKCFKVILFRCILASDTS